MKKTMNEGLRIPSALPLRFEDVNEQGEMTSGKESEVFFHFDYACAFYGSCSFQARIIEDAQIGIGLAADSISVESYELKKGSLSILLKTAQTFFNRKLIHHTT